MIGQLTRLLTFSNFADFVLITKHIRELLLPQSKNAAHKCSKTHIINNVGGMWSKTFPD